MHVDFPQTFCLGAAARRDITPPVGIYHRMWGAATHDRSTGVHRPLTATALALAPETEHNTPGGDVAQRAQVVVAVDHCLLWSDEMDALRAAVCRKSGLELDQLHVALSHTHAAGLMDPGRASLPGGELIAPYLDLLAERIGEAASEALGLLRPVRIVYGAGRCALAAHRDFWDAENGWFVCGYNPGGPADDTVLVARIADEQSRMVATVVNYACHATTLAWDNTLLSPDYVGAMRELVENATGAPCVFLQGASGDLGPRRGYVGDVAVADRNGRELGYAALAALESLGPPGTRFEYTGPVVSGATLGTWDYRPLEPDKLCEKYRWHSAQWKVELPYRADLPNREETESQLIHWQQEEQAAIARGEVAQARDCRAGAERMMRQLSRLRSLPAGDSLGVPVSVWRVGDAFWVLIAGEYYNLLQRSLRKRFPEHPIVIATVTDGWRPGYVPTADTYGKGIYQESIAIVSPGSLEKLIEVVGDQLAALRSR
ncbi:MAG: hypothetical protein WD063_02670 [Pirellulales bacterium]